jgi:hypothetical protein
MRYDRNFNRTAGAPVTPSPLLLCSFPCGISRIACCLPLSFECTFAFGLLGRLTRRHFGSNTLGLESHQRPMPCRLLKSASGSKSAERDWPKWLGEEPATPDELKAMLVPCSNEALKTWPVNRERVGNVRYKSPEVAEPEGRV